MAFRYLRYRCFDSLRCWRLPIIKSHSFQVFVIRGTSSRPPGRPSTSRPRKTRRSSHFSPWRGIRRGNASIREPVSYHVAVLTIALCRTCELLPCGQQGGNSMAERSNITAVYKATKTTSQRTAPRGSDFTTYAAPASGRRTSPS